MSITIMMSNALHSKTNKISYSMRVLVLMLFGGVGQHTGENGMRDMKWLKTEKNGLLSYPLSWDISKGYIAFSV